LIQYNIYKGKSRSGIPKFGAIQFSFKPPVLSDDFRKEREGIIFVNAASATTSDVYDWSNKFVFALGLTDLGKILHFFISAGAGDSASLYHDPDKGKENEGTKVKTMSFYTKEGCLNGCMITCSTKQDSNIVSHKIPVSGDEVIILRSLFDAAIPAMLGWNHAI
jgi:hypothetical protein